MKFLATFPLKSGFGIFTTEQLFENAESTWRRLPVSLPDWVLFSSDEGLYLRKKRENNLAPGPVAGINLPGWCFVRASFHFVPVAFKSDIPPGCMLPVVPLISRGRVATMHKGGGENKGLPLNHLCDYRPSSLKLFPSWNESASSQVKRF